MKKSPVVWGRLGWLMLPVLLLATLAEGEEEEMPAAWVARQEVALGRLFFTPEQRLVLDRLRLGLSAVAESEPLEGDTTSKESATELVPPPKVIVGPRFVSISGIVLKGNNQAVVWLNGQPLESNEPFEGEGFRALPDQLDERGVTIIPEGSTRVFQLKSGQTLDLVEEQIKNTYEITPSLLKTRREPPPTEDNAEAKDPDKQAKEAKDPDKQAKEAKGPDKQAKDKGAELAETIKKAADAAKKLKELKSQEGGLGNLP